MKGKVAVVLGVMLLGVWGCDSNSGNSYGTNPPTIPPNTISLRYNAFNPSSMTVRSMTTITWTNNDGVTHTSTSDSPGWDTGDILPGASKTTTFTTPGTFTFHCTYHRAMGMTGTITVQ